MDKLSAVAGRGSTLAGRLLLPVRPVAALQTASEEFMSTTMESPPQLPSASAPPPEGDLSFWEKIGDFFNAISEGVVNVVTRVFGSSNERYLRRQGYLRQKDRDPPYSVAPGSLLEK